MFDVGYTLVDERSSWEAWADCGGVDRAELLATLAQLAADGLDHREIFRVFNIDRTAGSGWELSDADLYSDALPCLHRLREAGYKLAVVGNQPASMEPFFESLGVELEFVASSQSWAVLKPDPAFFTRVADELWLPPREIAYVGDRLDNDVFPAASLGMVGVFMARGPWGAAHAEWPEAAEVLTITSLDELPGVLQ